MYIYLDFRYMHWNTYVLNYVIVTSRFCIKRCYNRGYNILHHIPTRENAFFDKIILIDRNILYKNTYHVDSDWYPDIWEFHQKVHYGPTQVKCWLLISSIFDAMNFQHFLEMLEIMLLHFWKMLEIHCTKSARN